MPISPFFAYDENGEIEITLNGGYCPNYEELILVKKCLNNFIKSLGKEPQQKIDEHNREVEEENYNAQLETRYSPKLPKEPIRGYIYILKSRKFYKIGRTKNPESRLKTYQTENPHGIKVIEMTEVYDYEKAEATLLSRFEPKKQTGEWFNFNLNDVKEAKKLIAEFATLPF